MQLATFVAPSQNESNICLCLSLHGLQINICTSYIPTSAEHLACLFDHFLLVSAVLFRDLNVISCDIDYIDVLIMFICVLVLVHWC